VIATFAWDWIATVCVLGPPFIAVPEYCIVPVQVADIVTVAAVAAAPTAIVKAWVFVPPAFTVTVAGAFGVKYVYPPNVSAAPTLFAAAPPAGAVLLNVIVSVKLMPPT